MWKVILYCRSNGRSPVAAFIGTLDQDTQKNVDQAIRGLQFYGSSLRMPEAKQVTRELFELRIRGRQDIRLIYAKHDNDYIILHGLVKKSPALPLHDLRLAVKRLQNLN